MNLLSYFDFIIENSGVFRLYYSDSFRNILHAIKDNSKFSSGEYAVSTFLLEAEDSNQMVDKNTLIDITDKNDTISFIQSNRILRKYSHLSDGVLTADIIDDKDNEFWKKGRTDINIGRWSRRIIKDIYKTSAYSDSMIEKFVNAYKSTFDSLYNKVNLFEVVSGEEIRKWYLNSNYSVISGQLGSSCMSTKPKQGFFDIYVKNPDVCKLLILKDGENPDKILGRSLLWKIDTGENYQDRIYTIYDSDRLLFEKWAGDNDYLIHWESRGNFKVTLGDHTYMKYPYMDTFSMYNPDTNVLSDDNDLWPGQGYYRLENTDGGYMSDSVVWSEYYDDYIDSEEAVSVNITNSRVDWLRPSDTVYLSYRDEYWYSGSDDIEWSDFHEKHFHLDDLVRSGKLDDWLYVNSSEVIEITNNYEGDVDYVPKKRIDLYIEVDGGYYDRSNSIKDPYTGKYEFKDRQMSSGKTYYGYLKEKLQKEIGDNFVYKDLMVEKIVKLFKDGEYPDIKDDLKENALYKSIFNFYWGPGFSEENKPTEDDIICLLFAAIIGSTGMYFPSYIKKFSDEVHDRYNIWYEYSYTLKSKIDKFIKSFDYSLLGNDIYKLYLWFSL